MIQTENNKDVKLENKEFKASEIIKKGLEGAKNPLIFFDGRAESLVILHLLRKASNGKVTIPVLFIDTTQEFKEIYQYIEKMRKLWNFKLIIEKNEEALKTLKFAEDKEKCCTILKTKFLENAAKKYNIDRLFVFDHAINIDESFTTQDSFKIMFPIQSFSREDVWDYIKKYHLPYCSLYDKGYTNIQCTLCTEPGQLRVERHEKQDEEEIKKRLKALGYM